VVTYQLQVERRTAKAHRPKTDALPLDHVASSLESTYLLRLCSSMFTVYWLFASPPRHSFLGTYKRCTSALGCRLVGLYIAINFLFRLSIASSSSVLHLIIPAMWHTISILATCWWHWSYCLRLTLTRLEYSVRVGIMTWWDVMVPCNVTLWYQIKRYGINYVQSWQYDNDTPCLYSYRPTITMWARVG